MKYWKPIFLLALVFIAGVVTGVFGTRIAVRRAVQQAINHPEKTPSWAERELARRLALDFSQREQLHVVLSETRVKLRDLRREFQPQTMLINSNANARISALLTPEQRTRFEQFALENLLFTHPQRPATPRSGSKSPP